MADSGRGGEEPCRTGDEPQSRTCIEVGAFQVSADIDPTGELVMVHQPKSGIEVWDRSTGKVVANPETDVTGAERFDAETGLLLLDLEMLDARTGESSPQPTGGEQVCATGNSFYGIQAYEPSTQRWAVVTNSGLTLAGYRPVQGPANNPKLECFPIEEVPLNLKLRLTAEARTVTAASNGLVAVGTEQDALILIDTNGPDRSGDPIAAACELAGRNLTAAEWEQFIPDTDYRRTCPDLESVSKAPDPPELAADIESPPTPGQIRDALAPTGAAYLGECERSADTIELDRTVYCGSLAGSAPGEAVFPMTDGKEPRVRHVHFTVEDGEWIEESTYVPPPSEGVPADAPEWFTRLTKDG